MYGRIMNMTPRKVRRVLLQAEKGGCFERVEVLEHTASTMRSCVFKEVKKSQRQKRVAREAVIKTDGTVINVTEMFISDYMAMISTILEPQLAELP